jgi:hypothetical protein
MTDKIKPLAPYVGHVIAIIIAIVGGWNAMNVRMYETDKKVEIFIEQNKYIIKRMDKTDDINQQKFEQFQSFIITNGNNYATLLAQNAMILERLKSVK